VLSKPPSSFVHHVFSILLAAVVAFATRRAFLAFAVA
jgi:hypothetical protein